MKKSNGPSSHASKRHALGRKFDDSGEGFFPVENIGMAMGQGELPTNFGHIIKDGTYVKPLGEFMEQGSIKRAKHGHNHLGKLMEQGEGPSKSIK